MPRSIFKYLNMVMAKMATSGSLTHSVERELSRQILMQAVWMRWRAITMRLRRKRMEVVSMLNRSMIATEFASMMRMGMVYVIHLKYWAVRK